MAINGLSSAGNPPAVSPAMPKRAEAVPGSSSEGFTIPGTRQKTAAKPEPTPAELQELQANVDKANESELAKQTDISFSIDKKANAVVFKIVNRSSGEILRQFPSEQMLDFMRTVSESADSSAKAGLVFQGKA